MSGRVYVCLVLLFVSDWRTWCCFGCFWELKGWGLGECGVGVMGC